MLSQIEKLLLSQFSRFKFSHLLETSHLQSRKRENTLTFILTSTEISLPKQWITIFCLIFKEILVKYFCLPDFVLIYYFFKFYLTAKIEMSKICRAWLWISRILFPLNSLNNNIIHLINPSYKQLSFPTYVCNSP